MNDDQIDDLKQFIAATITQQTSHLDDRMDGLDSRMDGLDRRMDGLDSRMDGLESDVKEIKKAISNTIIPFIETVDDQVQNHEKRLTKLEKHAA